MSARLTSIAFVTETFPPEIGGTAMCAARLVDAARDHGLAVRLYRPRGNGPVLSGTGLSDCHVPGLDLPLHPGLRFGWPCGRKLRDEWTAAPPDLVHIVTEGPLGFSALRAARSLGIPTTSGFHTNFHSYSKHYGLGWLTRAGVSYLRAFHNATGGTMVPTSQVEAALGAIGFERLTVVGRGVDTSQFNPGHRSEELRARWGVRPSDAVALYVGRLAPEKNAALALNAFAEAQRQAPGARLVVVGDGPLRQELEKAFPRVIFTGALRGASLSEHYASADVFLFPSLTETFGNVTLEAMASGLPVVAFDDGAARLHIRNLENGVLAPQDDGQAFAAGVSMLVRDISRSRTLGLEAFREAGRAGWPAVGAAFVRFLESAHTAAANASRLRLPQAAPVAERSI